MLPARRGRGGKSLESLYNVPMSILEVTCPVCDEVLELTDADRAELSVGDAVV